MWELLLPTVTLPKLRVEGLALSSRVTPVPDREMMVAGDQRLFAVQMVIVPVTLPVEVGVNVALKLVLCPAARVSGRDSPDLLKPAPVTLACEIVRLAAPELVRVTVWVTVPPTTTFPKLMLAGRAVRTPEAATSFPVPDT